MTDQPFRRGRRVQGSRAALAGLVFSILFTTSLVLFASAPAPNSSSSDLRDFYAGAGHNTLLIVGCYLIPLSGIAFIWFMAAFRHRLASLVEVEDPLTSTAQTLAGVLFIAMLFAAGAAVVTISLQGRFSGSDTVTVIQARTLSGLGNALLIVFAARAFGVFMLSSIGRAMKAGLFPKWFGLLSAAGALFMLFSLFHWRWTLIVIPVWVLATSVFILIKRVEDARRRQTA